MQKVIGYVVAVVGVVVMALGSGFFGEIDLFGVSSLYVSGAGIALVIIGAVLTLVFGKVHGRQKSEEVPIYEGVGKNRKIVGYQRG